MTNEKIFNILFIILLSFSINVASLYSQTTHAHASSQLWKGVDLTCVLDTLTNDSPIYLYNVGTGKFAIQGGTWAMEARLFYEDFGLQMALRKNSSTSFKIYTHITELNVSSDKQYLICNIPRLNSKGWKYVPDYSFTTIMDGQGSAPSWEFRRVDDEGVNSETHTYYLYQTYKNSYTSNNNLRFYLGAGYGEWCPDGTITYIDNSKNDKGNGYYVHIDDDRSVWTTAGQNGRYGGGNETLPYENADKVIVNGDSVAIKELYQWRIISEEEFEEVLLSTVQGINPSVSSLIPDRDFTRNADDFYDYWVVSQSDTVLNDSARYGYTWGNITKGKDVGLNSVNGDAGTAYYSTQRWDAPVRLKKVFDNAKNAKYGFMSFEGVGSVYVTFTLPQPGWYQLESTSFCFGPEGHETFMFAQAGGINLTDEEKSSSLHAYMGYGTVELPRYTSINELKESFSDITFPEDAVLDKRNEQTNESIGEVLTKYPNKHNPKLWVYIDPIRFNIGGEYKNITIGFTKEWSTPILKGIKNNIKYCYDNDWLVADNIMVSYMGLAPCFLYEDESSLDYLVYDQNYVNERPSASPDSLYRGALSLDRKLKKNQWNSFSLPIPITGEQVRMAFGEDAHLVELVGVGTMSLNKNVIDFRTVELKNVDPLKPVIIPGKFYLLKPTIDPIEGVDNLGVFKTYYSLGRNFFSVKPLNGENGYYYELNTNKLYDTNVINSIDGSNDGTSYVSYVKTPQYNSFTIDDNGYNTINEQTGLYVPKGGYAVSNGTIYELNRDMPIKGFRGWIVLSHSIFDDDALNSPQMAISIDGEYNGEEITDIVNDVLVPIEINDNTFVYDIMGRRVGSIRDKLPKGIYIVKGKKFFIR